jgi:SAM-dependent methyltransferase
MTSPSPQDLARVAEKAEVQQYFNSTGFERWNRIYSDSDEVNRVQRNIRIGHQKTVDNVLAWLGEDADLGQRSFCDAGCGVGSLSLPLARLGAGKVAARDLSEAMVVEAIREARQEVFVAVSDAQEGDALGVARRRWQQVRCNQRLAERLLCSQAEADHLPRRLHEWPECWIDAAQLCGAERWRLHRHAVRR